MPVLARRHDLQKAQKRLHIVEGLLVALADLDNVVKAVRAATDGPAASRDLQSGFGLSQEQVLEARLAFRISPLHVPALLQRAAAVGDHSHRS